MTTEETTIEFKSKVFLESENHSENDKSHQNTPSDRYSHIHALLMSNLSEMKQQFINAQKKFEERKASRESKANLLMNEIQDQQKNDKSLVNENKIDLSNESINRKSNQQITENYDKINKITSKDDERKIQQLLQRLKELEADLASKKSIIEELGTLNTSNQETIKNQQERINELIYNNKQQSDKYSKKKQKRKIKDSKLKTEITTLKQKLSTSESNHNVITSELKEQIEELKKKVLELEIKLENENKLQYINSNNINQLENSSIENNLSNVIETNNIENKKNDIVEDKDLSILLKNSPISQMDIPIDEIREENLELYEIISNYEKFLEFMAEKVKLQLQNQKDSFSQKELIMKQEIQELELKLQTIENEKSEIESKFNKAVTVIQLAYEARSNEISEQDQYLPLLLEENNSLKQRLGNWEKYITSTNVTI